MSSSCSRLAAPPAALGRLAPRSLGPTNIRPRQRSPLRAGLRATPGGGGGGGNGTNGTKSASGADTGDVISILRAGDGADDSWRRRPGPRVADALDSAREHRSGLEGGIASSSLRNQSQSQSRGQIQHNDEQQRQHPRHAHGKHLEKNNRNGNRGGNNGGNRGGNHDASRPPATAEARDVVRAFDQLLHRGDLQGCVGVLTAALSAADESGDTREDERWVGSRGGAVDGHADGDAAKLGNSDVVASRAPLIRDNTGDRRRGSAGAPNRSPLARDIGRCLNPLHKDFLRACRDARRLDLALRYASALPPNPRLYSSLLGACAQSRDYTSAVHAFQLYARAGLAADAFAYSGLISAAGKAGEMAAAASALSDAVAERACDDGVFNAYIDACARRGDYDRAAATVATMRAAGVRPNVRTYNSLITAASRANNLPAAKAALAALDADPRGLEATDRTYGAALSAAAAAAALPGGNGNGTENVQWALEVYTRADKAGLGANNHAVSSLLTALARGVAGGVWPADDAVNRAVGIVQSLVGPELAPVAGARAETMPESVDRDGRGMGTGGDGITTGTSRGELSSSISRPALEKPQRQRPNVGIDVPQRRGRDGGRGGGGKKEEKVPNAAVWSALMSVCARAGRAREALDALALMRRRGYTLTPKSEPFSPCNPPPYTLKSNHKINTSIPKPIP